MNANQSKGFKKVTHCIFHVDGLILNSEVINEAVVKEIAATYNKPFTYDVSLKMIGKPQDKSAEVAIKELELPLTVNEFLKFFHQISMDRKMNADLLEGAERLVRHLAAHKIPIAVATSSPEDLYRLEITKHEELFKLFHHHVCASNDVDVKHSKPSPDIYLVAASRFKEKPNPAQCLVFESSPNGVQAAINAGMQVVMVPDERLSEEMREKATLVLKSLEDFKPEQFCLPSYRKLNSHSKSKSRHNK